MKISSTEGFVLAGGRSSRMGRNKALLQLRGETFLERARGALQRVSEQVVVVTSPGLTYPGFLCLHDLAPRRGPLGGIWTALESLRGEGAWILACDYPRIEGELFLQMSEGIRDDDLVYPCDRSGNAHPLAGFYSRRCLPVVRDRVRSGSLRVQDLLNDTRLRVRSLSAEEHGLCDRIFTNINTPRELATLRRGVTVPR